MTEWFVAPGGSTRQNGSLGRPWDLRTALDHPPQVQPGDTIYLRGGTYAFDDTLVSRLTGAAGLPIIVRAYQQETPILSISGNNNGLHLLGGAYCWYWGFELMNPSLDRESAVGGSDEGLIRGHGIYGESGLGIKLINLHVHDFGTGLFESQASGIQLYGCHFYNSGWFGPDRYHGPGLYIRNRNTWPRKRIEHCIVHENGRQGLQGFGGNGFSNFDVIQNIVFSGGFRPRNHRNLMFGDDDFGAEDTIFRGNQTYYSDAGGGAFQSNQLGGVAGSQRLQVLDNVFSSFAKFAVGMNNQVDETFSGNKVVGRKQNYSGPALETVALEAAAFEAAYPANEYYSDFEGGSLPNPTGLWVSFFPNKFGPDRNDPRGRGIAAVYNWDLDDAVALDISEAEALGKLGRGATITIRNAQNRAETVERVYNGGTISVPMTGWTKTLPIGLDDYEHWATFPQFGAFLLEWDATALVEGVRSGEVEGPVEVVGDVCSG